MEPLESGAEKSNGRTAAASFRCVQRRQGVAVNWFVLECHSQVSEECTARSSQEGRVGAQRFPRAIETRYQEWQVHSLVERIRCAACTILPGSRLRKDCEV